ncbi:glycerophosphodiester phosphodiesterase [Thalassotalea mangrovi]|uniref:glycerophosphodiester phosphodiesterase n=1 Tax=Thalassotalea mangrovi TaxID=2572245 RepID=UPI00145E3956|nr:glycerophosphodiester phosphodiesterase [Thalassotalea mangrovi]
MLLITALLWAGQISAARVSQGPLIIAHRGASGYLPEHTLASKALAHAMNADFLEQDVVMTRDNRLIVFHDLVLQHKTNVAAKYPGRKRFDGNYYVIDFTLAEIRQLDLTPPQSSPDRFPYVTKALKIPTLDEEITFIQGLNLTRHTQVGLYIEIKAPWFHRQQDKDITSALFALLLTRKEELTDTPVFLQSFDPNSLITLREKLDRVRWYLPLIQLIANDDWQQAYQQIDGKSQPYNFQRFLEEDGLREISSYAHGIGISIDHVFAEDCSYQGGKRWIQQAQNIGLIVHAYTFRRDKLPACTTSFRQLHQLFFSELNIDGIFTDYPDISADFRDNR